MMKSMILFFGEEMPQSVTDTQRTNILPVVFSERYVGAVIESV